MDLKIVHRLQLVVQTNPEDLVVVEQAEKLLTQLQMKEEQEIHLLYLHLKVNQVEEELKEQRLQQVNLDLVVVAVQLLQEVIAQLVETMDNLEEQGHLFQILFLDQQHQVTDNHRVL